MRLPAYSASAKVICFIIEKLGDWCPGILPNQEVFFRWYGRLPPAAGRPQHLYINRGSSLPRHLGAKVESG
ncbi:hypothetical protein C1890_33280 [Pseudomonas sp. DP16D-R1]|nr:hypothetical protein C1890_33280 [Pseudomonas sp. DP16D-R1]